MKTAAIVLALALTGCANIFYVEEPPVTSVPLNLHQFMRGGSYVIAAGDNQDWVYNIDVFEHPEYGWEVFYIYDAYAKPVQQILRTAEAVCFANQIGSPVVVPSSKACIAYEEIREAINIYLNQTYYVSHTP